MKALTLGKLLKFLTPCIAGAALYGQVPLGLLVSQQSRTAFTVQGAGARAEGIGGAFTAVADDATAVSFNPAGLAQLLDPEFSLVGMNYQRRFEHRGFISTDQVPALDLTDARAQDHSTLPTFASVTFPGKFKGKNMVFQLSLQRLFDLGQGLEWNLSEVDASGVLPQKFLRQNIRQKGQVDVWSAALAYDFSPRMLVGASFNLWRGSWDFTSTSDESVDPLPNAGMESAAIHEDDQMRGSNWNVGVLWRSEHLNLGAVYRSSFTAHFNSDTSTSTNVPDAHLPPRFTTSYPLEWPETLGFGAALRPVPEWLIAADWNRTKWSQAAFNAQGGSLDNLNFFDLQNPSRTPDAVAKRLGMEYLFFPGQSVVPLRVGIFEEPQPIADQITGERRTLKGWTLGVGWKKRGVSFDLAYKHSQGQRSASQFLEADEIASGRNVPTSRGNELIRENRIFLSCIVQFDRDATSRFLKWLFVQGN